MCWQPNLFHGDRSDMPPEEKLPGKNNCQEEEPARSLGLRRIQRKLGIPTLAEEVLAKQIDLWPGLDLNIAVNRRFAA